MRRFEFKDGKSQKFWQIEVDEESFTVQFGRIGTEGQTQVKSFTSPEKCEAEANKLIAAKVKKGYQEVDLGASAAKPAGKAKADAAPTGARNPELEAAILDADKPDLDAWQVYADWLQTQGDAWGERLSLSLQRQKAKGAAKAKFTKMIEEYDAAHADALYGKELAGMMAKQDFDQVVKIEAPFGLIMEVDTRSPNYDWKGASPKAVLAAIVKSPAAKLLRNVTIGILDHHYPISLAGGIDVLSKAGRLESLRSLFIGAFEYPDESEISWVSVGNVSKILALAPNLRSLHLRGADIGLGTLEHKTLESLTIETGGLPGSAVASIGKAKLPQLRHMEVWLGTDEYGGTGKISQLKGLFSGEGVPKLEHFGLKNSDFEDDIAVALSTSKLLAQLKRVDLSMGTLHESGAQAILANADRFKHLESLDLDRNFIPDDLATQLRRALKGIVSVGDQEEPSDWDEEPHYYVSVGE